MSQTVLDSNKNAKGSINMNELLIMEQQRELFYRKLSAERRTHDLLITMMLQYCCFDSIHNT